MKSDSLFVKCKSCGKDISKSASACPHCGAKQKKLKAIHWVGIVFGILILIGIVSSPESEQKQETNKSNHSTTSAIAKKQTIQKPTNKDRSCEERTMISSGVEQARSHYI